MDCELNHCVVLADTSMSDVLAQRWGRGDFLTHLCNPPSFYVGVLWSFFCYTELLSFLCCVCYSVKTSCVYVCLGLNHMEKKRNSRNCLSLPWLYLATFPCSLSVLPFRSLLWNKASQANNSGSPWRSFNPLCSNMFCSAWGLAKPCLILFTLQPMSW